MEYKFKAWVKPVIENGEVIYTGCNVSCQMHRCNTSI